MLLRLQISVVVGRLYVLIHVLGHVGIPVVLAAVVFAGLSGIVVSILVFPVYQWISEEMNPGRTQLSSS